MGTLWPRFAIKWHLTLWTFWIVPIFGVWNFSLASCRFSLYCLFSALFVCCCIMGVNVKEGRRYLVLVGTSLSTWWGQEITIYRLYKYYVILFNIFYIKMPGQLSRVLYVVTFIISPTPSYFCNLTEILFAFLWIIVLLFEPEKTLKST